jgi:ABC-type polysaccharide/polyol phosphate transport system ATPase subunit
MSKINLKNVTLTYPIFGGNTRSFKHTLANIATGGRFTKEKNKIEVKALDDITLSLSRGDKLGLIGHNGAGKSTLLRILAGIFEPEKGEVIIKGNVSSLLDLQVGMQLESNAYDNIRTKGLLLGLSKDEINQIIYDVEEFTELGNFLSLPVKTYSSGMLMRLAFGLATSCIPDILLIDEVIGTGDANFLNKAQQRLEKLISKSNILVLSSHSTEIIQKFCTKVLWLEHGKIKELGEVSRIIEMYNNLVRM